MIFFYIWRSLVRNRIAPNAHYNKYINYNMHIKL